MSSSGRLIRGSINDENLGGHVLRPRTGGGILGATAVSTDNPPLLAAVFLAPDAAAGLVQCLRGERRRPRCASRAPPQLRDGLRRFRAGLGRSSSDPTAASEAKDCDLPSKNLDRPLLRTQIKAARRQTTAPQHTRQDQISVIRKERGSNARPIGEYVRTYLIGSCVMSEAISK